MHWNWKKWECKMLRKQGDASEDSNAWLYWLKWICREKMACRIDTVGKVRKIMLFTAS